MPSASPDYSLRFVSSRRFPALLVSAALCTATVISGAVAVGGTTPDGPSGLTRAVTYHGYHIDVPRHWKVVHLDARPHACVRFDRPSVYLGHPGEQQTCPSHLIGGAPGLLVEPLAARSGPGLRRSTVPTAPGGSVRDGLLPDRGPVSVVVQGAGVLVTAVYGEDSLPIVQRALAEGRVLANAHPMTSSFSGMSPGSGTVGDSVPGTYTGQGFDACTAPSQAAMDAWRTWSNYQAVGVYIGGVSRGCAQPNLTSAWVAQQIAQGWHLIATYVGEQAPCTRFYNRMSYDPRTARAQGRADAVDAVAQARTLGMAAPSTVYADIEGYDNTNSGCVAAVLSYVSGWTRGLHADAYRAGVYSSVSSGIRDLSTSYGSAAYNSPDEIWLAWWNYAADVAGGSYVPDTLWSNHQRIHQFVGGASETHGGYTISIDRDYLDVSSAVSRPTGCPTNLDFGSYRVLRSGDTGNQVIAAQCLLARRGFDPGAATGLVRWRTAAAIRAFNTSRGLLDVAVVGRRTWTALLSGGRTRVLQVGSAGPAVGRIQRALSASLQRTVTIDETFDPATRRAVLDYQRAHQLVADGIVRRQTWHALQAGL